MTRTIMALSTTLLLCLAPSEGNARIGAGQSIDLAFVNCTNAHIAYSSPMLVVADQHDKVLMSKSFPREANKVVRHLTLSLSPGFYHISVSNGDCSDDVYVPVLLGHNRKIVVLSRNRAVLASRLGVVYGLLPMAGWRVSIVYEDRRARVGESSSPDGYLEIPAVVERDACYATALPTGKPTVRLYNQRLSRRVDFTAGIFA